MNWSQYARVYDLMAESNPAYQQMVDDFCSALKVWKIPRDGLILDLGAGTGNFSLAVARHYPQCRIIHLDQDASMIARAREKANLLGLVNVDFVEGDIGSDAWGHRPVQLLLSVHCLYACGCHVRALERACSMLAPAGIAYLIDVGRCMDVHDWSKYLFKHLCRAEGFFRAVSTFARGIPVARANRAIWRRQKAGAYWTHTTAEFAEQLNASGFTILKLDTCYRGYSDRAICKRGNAVAG
jgi:SAM-dependent methyltransferase